MLRKFLFASSCLGVFISTASAADRPPVATVQNWSGFYLGGNLGYGWSDAASSMGFLLFDVPSPLPVGVPGTYRPGGNGAVGGGQIGVNYQISRAVFGAEADISSGFKGQEVANGATPSQGGPVPFTSTQTQAIDWLATVRGRVGFLPIDSLLIYATGGFAIGGVSHSSRLAFAGVGGTTYFGTDSSTRTGWTVGGGGEYLIGSNLSVKLEYLYYDLGASSFFARDVLFPNQPFKLQAQFTGRGQIARIGLNYRFGPR